LYENEKAELPAWQDIFCDKIAYWMNMNQKYCRVSQWILLAKRKEDC